MVGQITVTPLPATENNTTEELVVVEMEEDDESFMPFLSMPSISAAIAAAVLLRKEDESLQ